MVKLAPIKISCTALTPIWTGDPDGKGGQILETGILGSMRWWYEMALRGLGIFICDPTQGGCTLKASAYKTNPDESLKGLCPACLLFGCTGWKRRFLLRVEFDLKELSAYEVQSLGGPSHSNVTWLKKTLNMETGNQLLPIGPFTITIQPHKNWEGDVKEQLIALFNIMSQLCGIGAKTQNGFGQFTLNDSKQKLELDIAKNHIQEFANRQSNGAKKNPDALYSLNQYWGYEVSNIDVNRLKSITPVKFLGEGGKNLCYPVAFDIRTSVKIGGRDLGIRQAYKAELKKQCKTPYKHGEKKTCSDCASKTTALFGNLARAGRIFVSHPIRRAGQTKGEIRVWGFTTQEFKETLATIIESQMEAFFGSDSDSIQKMTNPFANLGGTSNV